MGKARVGENTVFMRLERRSMWAGAQRWAEEEGER